MNAPAFLVINVVLQRNFNFDINDIASELYYVSVTQAKYQVCECAFNRIVYHHKGK